MDLKSNRWVTMDQNIRPERGAYAWQCAPGRTFDHFSSVTIDSMWLTLLIIIIIVLILRLT